MADIRIDLGANPAAEKLLLSSTAGMEVYTNPYLLTDGKSLVDPLPTEVSAVPVIRAGSLVAPVDPSELAGGGQPEVQLWTPVNASPTMRYDPAAPAGTTRSGASVVTLHDLSGGYDLTQSTGSMQPQTGRAIGGRAVLDFDGGDLLTRTTGLPSPGSGDSMVAIVADIDTLAGSPFRGREGTGTRWGFLVSSGDLIFVHNSAFAGARAPATIGPQIIVGYRSGSTTYLRRNGTLIATGPAGICPPLSAIEIGNVLDGAVGEAIPTLSYSDDLRDRLEGYLAHAYGLAALLPADHPYKSTPPLVTP